MQLDLFPIIAETILLNDDEAIPRLPVLNKGLAVTDKKTDLQGYPGYTGEKLKMVCNLTILILFILPILVK